MLDAVTGSAKLFRRIAELEKSEAYWKSEAKRYCGNADYWRCRYDQLQSRVNQAIPLVGHKSLDSRRELLAILEGNDD